MKTGLFFYGHLGDGAATGLVFDNNNVSFSGRPITASPYAVFHGTAPDFHIRVPNYSAVMPILQGLVTSPPKSSTIFDPTIGRTYNVNAEGKIDRVPR